MKRLLLLTWLMPITFFYTLAQAIELKPSFTYRVKRAPGQLYTALDIDAEGKIQGKTNSVQLFEAEIRKGKLNGEWKSRFSNGQLLDSGYLKKGIPHGIWKVWDSSGRLVAIRNYDADLFIRIREELELNHPRFQHTVIAVRYKREGASVLTYLTVNYSFPDAQLPVTKSLEGWVTSNQERLRTYHPVFIECLHHGFYLNKTSDGIVTDSGYYKNGLREGVWVHRNPKNGFTEKGLYHQGYQKKEWKEYDSKGRLTAISYFNHGKLIWRKER
jgi:hypothetical protein